MSLIALENIVKEYGTRKLLNGVSLRVHRGERVALVGANGSGKSTLIRIAIGLDFADSGNVVVSKRTKVGYLSQNLEELTDLGAFDEVAQAFEKVSALEQRLRALENDLTDPKKMDEYARLTAEFEVLDGYNLETKIKTTLLGLGLRESALTLPVTSLSGGERMRVALARILLDEPELLILDEPTNHLDIPATEWLESFLRSFSGGVLLVSHDRYFLDQVATKVIELEYGTLEERSGNYSTYIEQKAVVQAYTDQERKRLNRAISREEAIARQLMGMRKISAARSREKAAARLKEELSKTGAGSHLRRSRGPTFSFNPAAHISAEVARAQDLTKMFGIVEIFRGAHFLIKGGERVGIVGPNGCGKTTLLNILLGKDADYKGFARLGPWVRFAYMGQELEFDDEDLSIREEILRRRDMKESEVRDYLARFLFYGDDIEKRISILSGGEKVRLYIAGLMLDEPNCLILDEPTNHLDMPAREALEDAISQFRGTIIAVSHDRFFLNRCINRILEIRRGKIRSYDGNYELYKKAKFEEQRKGLISRDSGTLSGKAVLGRTPAGRSARKFEKVSIGSMSDVVALERAIGKLESRAKELETGFGTSASYQDYKEYSSITDELNRLYEAWEKLAEAEGIWTD